MCGGQAVVIDRKVYYGGGEANNKDVCYLVQCYDPSQDEWTTLPPLPVRYFGLGQIYGQLVAVGGERKLQREEFERSKHVYTYDGNGRAWRETLPPMSSALLHPAVISHKSMLVVAGGDHFGVVKRSVEIFRQNQEEAVGKWCRTRKSLQEACFGLSTVSSDSESKLYALGGKNDHGNLNQAIYISTENLHCCSATELDNRTSELADLSLLFSSTDVLRRKQALDDSPWKELPNTVTYSPAASMLGSSLIAIGGWDTADQEGSNVKTNIMMYSSGTNSWIYIGDLPAPRAKITAAVLSLAEVLVIGGWDGQGMSKAVYKLSLLLK